MALFPPPGAGEPLTLPFSSGTASRAGRPSDADAGAPGTGPGSTQLDLLRDSIALVTALLPGSEGDSDLVTGLLDGTDADHLLGVSATTAWLASHLVQQLDELHGGAGTAWLRGLAIGLADEP